MKVALFCIYGLFLTFVIGYAVYATATFDGAIEHSYEKGMAYPKKMAQLHELNWRFQTGEGQFRPGENDLLELWIKDKYNQPVHGANVRFEIYRPAGRETLPVQSAREITPGHYISTIQVPAYGYWQIRAIMVRDKVQVEHEFQIYAEAVSKPSIGPKIKAGVGFKPEIQSAASTN